jgi:hypothetical protein
LKDFLNATMERVNVDRINVDEVRERPTPVSQGNVLSRGAIAGMVFTGCHSARSAAVLLRAEAMPYRVWIAAISIIAISIIVSGFGKAEAGDVEAVAPGASGVLTKCRDWFVATSCNTYQHITLPPRIAVGDTVPLRFGSNPKEYSLPVARIDVKRHHCAIFSEAEGNRHRMDKINVVPCYPADERR